MIGKLRAVERWRAAGRAVLPLMGPSRKKPAARSRSRFSTTRRACRCTRKRPARHCGRRWGCSTTSSCTTSTWRRTAPTRSSPIWPTSWSWSEDGKELTFPLRQGVKWHDGKPFTAADVKCTWDLLLGNGSEKLRVNPRQTWYSNLDRVATNGDYEVTFHLKRPQPALLSLLASGWSPVYPCHVPASRHAAASDRHGPVQIRRVQAERGGQDGAQPGLLEAGPALSRRHRMAHHAGPSRRET